MISAALLFMLETEMQSNNVSIKMREMVPVAFRSELLNPCLIFFNLKKASVLEVLNRCH